MTGLILHHYDASPYSEKIRLLLGFKGLAWDSVTVPPIAPKADLLALTGGYRRVPVMQIGADIYADSALIAAELDRRYPDRPLAPAGSGVATPLLDDWADRVLFWQVVHYAMGLRADAIPPALIHDRETFWARPIDLDALRAGAGHQREQITQGLGWLDALLGGAAFFGGAGPALSDFALYHPLWYFAAADGAAGGSGLKGFAALADWMARMAAFGHGQRRDIAPADALAIARKSTLADANAGAPLHPLIGQPVEVVVEEFGTETIAGTLASIDARTLTLHRGLNGGGMVAVHLPRRGYALRAAAAGAETAAG